MKIKASVGTVNKAMTAIKSAGGTVNVKGNVGNVSVKGVTADFVFDSEAEELNINITDKPFLISTDFVEDEIKKFFS